MGLDGASAGGLAGPGGGGPEAGPEPGADGAVRLEVCQGSSCREVGNADLLAELERHSGLRRDRETPGRCLVLLAGVCQGRCAVGPNVKLNGEAFSVEGPSEARVLLARAEALVKKSA